MRYPDRAELKRARERGDLDVAALPGPVPLGRVPPLTGELPGLPAGEPAPHPAHPFFRPEKREPAAFDFAAERLKEGNPILLAYTGWKNFSSTSNAA